MDTEQTVEQMFAAQVLRTMLYRRELETSVCLVQAAWLALREGFAETALQLLDDIVQGGLEVLNNLSEPQDAP